MMKKLLFALLLILAIVAIAESQKVKSKSFLKSFFSVRKKQQMDFGFILLFVFSDFVFSQTASYANQ